MIYTFYSYKGGVGRSMALANVAKWFYLQGLRVIIIDWDLEAPGLENFFYDSEHDLDVVRSQLGLIDMLMAYKRLFPQLPMPLNKNGILGETDSPDAEDTKDALAVLEENLPPISDMLYPIHVPEPSDYGKGAALWLLTAGWRSGDRFPLYAQAVQGFDWADFYASFQGEAFFEWMRAQLNSDSLADLVLIDSRTGVTEMGGVCTRQLADVVVSFCVPNLQNLVGVATMARSFKRSDVITKRNQRTIETVMVPTRIDVNELGSRNLFEKSFTERLDEFTPRIFKSAQSGFWDLAIQYIPQYAYSEKLAIGVEDGAKELEESYKRLAAHLVVLAQGDPALRIRKRFGAELQRIFKDRLPSVFISYVSSDGGPIARELRGRLEAHSIPLLPDFNDMSDKPDGWRQVTAILDQAKSMLLVLTPDVLDSDLARRQWRYARQQGVCVYLVKRPAPDSDGHVTDLPRWLRGAVFYDAVEDWETLVRQLQNPPQVTRVPFMAPDAPDDFVCRSVEMGQLKGALLTADGESQEAANVALWGSPGSGKSTLARAFCHEEDVMTAYGDGILWVTLGVSPNIQGEMTKLYASLTGEIRTFIDEEDASIRVAEKLEEKNCLLVIDDVWNVKHLQPFLRGGKRCARLITTGDLNIVTSIGAKHIAVREMTVDEATQMIAGQLKLSPYDLRFFEKFEEQLGRLPLALKLAKAPLQNRIELGDHPIEALKSLRKILDKNGVTAFDLPDAIERDQSIGLSIASSLDLLPEEDRRRYVQLAFFPEQSDIPLAEAGELWKLNEFEAEEQVQRLRCLSLLRYDAKERTINLSTVMRSYIINLMPNQADLDAKIEAAFAHLSPEEQDVARRVCIRLVRPAQIEEVGQDTRRRIKLKNLDDKSKAVVDRLAQARVVAKGQDKTTGEQTVELTDDLIIQNWDRLKRWISDDREFLLWRLQMESAKADWERKGRGKSALMSGSLLENAKYWQSKRGEDLDETEINYINDSARLSRQHRNKRVAVAAVITLLIAVAFGFAKIQIDKRADEAALKASIEHIKVGKDNLSKNRREEAIDEFAKAVEAKPDNAEAYYNLGLAYYEYGDLESAIAHYDKAISLNPTYAEAYLNRGRAYRHLNEVDQAISDYTLAINLNPSDKTDRAKAYNFRAFAYYKKGDSDKALEGCEKAISIDPTYADAYDTLGTIYRSMEDFPQAIQKYTKAIELDPSYVVAYSNRGIAHYLTGRASADTKVKRDNFSLAINDLNKGITLFQNLKQDVPRKANYVEAFYYRGRTYMDCDDYTSAVMDFTSAIENIISKGLAEQLKERYAETYLLRGLAYRKLGDLEKATADIQRGRELTPPDKEAVLEHLFQQPADPRIYVYYDNSNDQSMVETMAQRIGETIGYKIRVRLRPGITEGAVRYYHVEDKANATRVREAFILSLGQAGTSLRLIDLSKRHGDVAAGTIEVWLPSSAP